MTRTYLTLYLFTALLMVPGSAGAEPGHKHEAKPSKAEQVKLFQEFMGLKQQVAMTQAKVLKDDPALRKEHLALQKRFVVALKKQGIHLDRELAALGQLKKKLEKGGLGDAERAKLLQEGQKRGLALKKAEQIARKDPALKKAMISLQKKTEAAMLRVDPKLKEQMNRLKQLKAKLKSFQAAAEGPAKGGPHGH